MSMLPNSSSGRAEQPVRQRVEPDREHARATMLVVDSTVGRVIAAVVQRCSLGGSRTATMLVPVGDAVRKLERWQQVRLAGVTLMAALVVHTVLSLLLPGRFGPLLPALGWVAAGALAMTMILASRAIVAAWDDWHA
jgi:hypothetical protein